MRRGVLAAGAAMTAVFGSVLLPATANSAVRSSTSSSAVVTAVSCSDGGTCAAGGQAFATAGQGIPFVLTGKNGQWGRGVAVPGLAALKPADAGIDSVSCAPAGGCVAGGTWVNTATRNHVFHVFVTSERNGRWSHLTELFKGKLAAAGVDLSCPAKGSCAAGDGLPLFAVSEAKGRWGRAIQFPTKAKFGGVGVTCTSAGNCLAWFEKFVVTERNGKWGKPAAVPGLAALGTGAGISSVTCSVAGDCAAAGSYTHGSDGTEVFVTSERGGRWGKAIEIPGFTVLNKEGDGSPSAVSCLSPGNCVVGGSYTVPADFQGGSFQAFVASERNGRWGKAIEVPGIPAPSSAICEPDSDRCVAGQVLSLSCSLGGTTCVAGGWYDTKAINGSAAFVTTYKNGHWSNVMQFSGLAAPDDSQVSSLSCTPSGKCAGGGSGRTTGPGFLTFEKNGTWSPAQPVRF